MIDTHAHVFKNGLALARERRYAPKYEAPTDLYLAQLDSHGISGGVLVQPSFLGTDCRYLLTALRAEPNRLRGVAVIKPDCGADELTEMARAGVTGIRLNLIGLPDLPLEQRVTSKSLFHVNDLNWHVEVHAEAARLEGTVLPLLERGCTVVVDHFGRPDPTLGVSDPGFQWLLSMAGQPNLFVKLSAPYRNWDQKTEAGRNSARDAARLLLEAYTPARLMWGSDWPHTQFETSQSYGQSLEDIKALLPDESTRIAVLSETARRFYRFRDSAPEIKKQHS